MIHLGPQRGVDGLPVHAFNHRVNDRADRRVGGYAADAEMVGSQIIRLGIEADNDHRVGGEAANPTPAPSVHAHPLTSNTGIPLQAIATSASTALAAAT